MDWLIYSTKTTKEELVEKLIYLDKDVKIEYGVKIASGVKVFGETIILKGCEIGVNSVISNSFLNENVQVLSSFIENSVIGKNSTIGPFANIKNNSEIGEYCRIGNYVEIKKSQIGNNVKIAHLTYVGDACISDDCNVGCGVVFCNYNGEVKMKSNVGKRVFIGSNVNIIAPVEIGDEVYIAAGTTVSKDVEKGKFVIGRNKQIEKENFKNPYLINKK